MEPQDYVRPVREARLRALFRPYLLFPMDTLVVILAIDLYYKPILTQTGRTFVTYSMVVLMYTCIRYRKAYQVLREKLRKS